MVLYYPVSALVTLFANILQNPQDVRARSDVRLMHSVVEFLSMLSAEESHGHVRRMLTICTEFERVSRSALEKAEREIRGRGKRAHKEEMSNPSKSIVEQQIEAQSAYRNPVQVGFRSGSISSAAPATTPGGLSDPGRPQGARSHSRSQLDLSHSRSQSQPQVGQAQHLGAPQTQPGYSNLSSPMRSEEWEMDVNNGFYPTNLANGGQHLDTSQHFVPRHPAMPQAVNSGSSNDMQQQQFSDAQISQMTNGNTFQQPFVPQDLWQMPMTLEWDWSDVGMVGPSMNVGMGSANVYDFGMNGMNGMNGMGG